MLHRWSSSGDREFHDALFGSQRYEPFTFAYPGYVTIRRFAELAGRHLGGVRRVMDLGCGPGEITCELARRNPQIAFVGLDHSATAIARASEHRANLKLTNVTFETGDIMGFTAEDVDAVLMFDSFHHLLDPAAFVQSLRPRVARFVLVEPAGDWLGGWQKTLDMDWIVPAIDDIRARLVYQLNLPDGTSAPPEGWAAQGHPVEHRYTQSDFHRFFDGYGIQARGTLAGVESYPPRPYAGLPLREAFGEVAYRTLTSIEELLVRENLDLHAKHWVICAERGEPHRLRTPAPLNPRPHQLVAGGPYAIEYLEAHGPSTIAAGSTFAISLVIRNTGWRTWRSDDPAHPVLASYHWIARDGTLAVEDGRRTPLPHALAPGETLAMTCHVEAPPARGRYELALDLVEEGVTWFSRAGAPMRRMRVGIR